MLIAVCSSYVAFLVSSKIVTSENKKYQALWLNSGALSLGFGIWAMHFIGMLAYELPRTINYDVTLTVISFIPALVFSYIVLRTSNKLSLKRGSLLYRSLFMSGGIALMHYIGMSAMHVDANMVYDLTLFIASFVIAFALSWISLVQKLDAEKYVSKSVIFNSRFILPAVFMGCAISSMHYTGMAAMTMYSNSTPTIIPLSSWSNESLVNIITVITLLLALLLVVALEVSHRLSLYLRINISEKKAIDNAETLKKIVSRVPGMVYQFELRPDGSMCFPYISDSISEVYEITAEQGMADVNNIFSATYEDDLEILNETIEESAKNMMPWKLEYRIKLKDGGVRWLYGDSKPEKLPDGGILWHGFVTDITKSKETDESLRRSQKMEALGKLTGGIAHDYNNMLGVVIGYTELLQLTSDDKPEQNKYLEEIIHAADRGTKLTNKLLSFSRNTLSDVETININDILISQQLMLEKTLTARIQVSFNLANDLWFTSLDASELEDAILNICINAMHAVENNGYLTIETQNEKINFLSARQLNIDSGDYIRLSISDTGSGMSEAVKEKMFDPFYSTKGEKGTGLGLSQVYGFIMRSKGAVKVDSVIGEGSQFHLYFPRSENNEAKLDIVSDGSLNTETLKDKAILVVDDEPALLSFINATFKNSSNFQVFSASNAKEALVILENENIDLLLSDVIMPEMDGYELASIVKDKYPSIKIQLMSGFTGDEKSQFECDELSKKILKKPFSVDTLMNKVKGMLSS